MGLLEPSDWTARWIGNREDAYPDSTLTTPAPYFRKTFRINKPVKQAKAYICGLVYENVPEWRKGRRPGIGSRRYQFRSSFAQKDVVFLMINLTKGVLYNTFDVTSLVQKAENTVGVLLGNGWYEGQH